MTVMKDGEWFIPAMSNHLLECCDCGLKHRVDFAVLDKDDLRLVNGGYVAMRCYRVKKKPKKEVRK